MSGSVPPPGPAKVRALPPVNLVPIREGDWRDDLIYRSTKTDRAIVACTANAITILQGDEKWKGRLYWDLFCQGIMARDPSALPWDPNDAPAKELDDGLDRSGAWRDTDGVRLQAWLARHYQLYLTPQQCYHAAQVVAESAAENPLRIWLDSLRWDCVPRVNAWLSTYLGAPDTPYARLVGRFFLVSAVARAFRPGCKVDTMLVLEGEQGKGKSSAAAVLAGANWFSDTAIDFGSKDRFLALRNVWIQEVAELDGMAKAEVTRIKGFLSSARDDFRPPYGQQLIRVPRRSVLLGTVNPEGGGGLGYFKDSTGFRRAWPVPAPRVDLAGLARDRAMLWAEAVQILRGKAGGEPLGPDLPSPGARWYPSTDMEHALCREEQAERSAVDPWQGAIEDYLLRKGPGAMVTIREVLSAFPLGVELSKQGKTEQTRAGICIAASGWHAVERKLEPPRADGEPRKKERLYQKKAE